MELREFVAETLTQIAAGVSDAQTKAEKVGANINPRLSGGATYAVQHGFLTSQSGPAQVVTFDVALTVTEEKGTKGGIGVFVGAVTLGSSGHSNAENTSVSRVKFSVPVVLPIKAKGS